MSILKIIDISNNKTIGHNWNTGDGLRFDGVDSYVGYAIPPSGIAGVGDFSISIIYYAENNNPIGGASPRLLTTGFATGNASVGSVDIGLNVFRFYFSPILYSEVGSVLLLNQLVHRVYVKRANLLQCQVYTNGVLTSTGVTNTNLPVIVSNNFRLGAKTTAPSGIYNGVIFDTKVFDRALTALEISQLYIKVGNLVPASSVSALRLDARFNSKQGTVAVDSSSSGVTGSLTNFNSTAIGVTNSWVDKYRNPITIY
jgi:hypothetical protein